MINTANASHYLGWITNEGEIVVNMFTVSGLRQYAGGIVGMSRGLSYELAEGFGEWTNFGLLNFSAAGTNDIYAAGSRFAVIRKRRNWSASITKAGLSRAIITILITPRSSMILAEAASPSRSPRITQITISAPTPIFAAFTSTRTFPLRYY